MDPSQGGLKGSKPREKGAHSHSRNGSINGKEGDKERERERKKEKEKGEEKGETLRTNPFILSEDKLTEEQRERDNEIQPWGVKDIGVNCISSAVNDPTGKYPPVKVTKHLPIVPPTPIPQVLLSDFNSYRTRIAKSYPQFRSNHAKTLRHFNPYLGEEDDPQEAFQDVASKRVGPLDSVVPSMFFDPDFSIEDPATFKTIIEGDSPSSQISSATLLQEKLSYYLDLVEVRLVQQVSDRSSSFFSALSILNKVHDEITQACSVINGLREHIASLDQILALKGLEVVFLKQKKERLEAIYELVKGISEVNQAKSTVRLLLSQGDYANALDLSMAAQRVLETDLVGVKCFKHLGSEFSEMRTAIERVMKIEFSSGLMKFVLETLPQGSHSEHYLLFEQQLAPLFFGLARVGKLAESFEAYKEALMRKIKQIIKNKAAEMIDIFASGSEHLDPADGSNPTSIVQQLKELPSEAYLAVMSNIYDMLLNILEQLKQTNELVEMLLKNLAANPDPETDDSDDLKNPGVIQKILSDSQELVLSLLELTHIRCAKLLELRKEANMTIPLKEFAKLFLRTSEFIELSEALVSKKRTHGLQGILVSQAKGFLDHFHQEKVSIIASLIENEQWTQVAVPYEFQRLLDQLMSITFDIQDVNFVNPVNEALNSKDEDGDDLDEKESQSQSQASLPTNQQPAEPPPSSESSKSSAGAPGPKNFVVFNGQRFYIITCALMFLKFLGEYLQFLSLLPTVSTELAQRMVEIVQIFNSRTCQMILGGGALTTAGLKNIKTRHLALASQSLSLLLLILPNVKEKFKLQMQAKQRILLSEFDRIIKDVREHQNEIHLKLTSVIPSRLEISKQVLKNTDWADPSTKPPTQFAKGLIADITALNKVISRYLLKEIHKQIMENVFRQINHILEAELTKFEFESQEAKDRLGIEIRFLITETELVGNLGGLGNSLISALEANNNIGKRKELRPAPKVEDVKKKFGMFLAS